MKKILIAILNWNTSKETMDCIKSIVRYTDKYPFEIVVLDNNSSEDQYHKLNIIPKKFKVVRSITNLGYAGGNNKIVEDFFLKNREFSHVLILNNDTEITEDVLAKLVEHPKSNTSVLGPVICDYARKTIQSCGGRVTPVVFMTKYFHELNEEVDFISGCCLLIPRIVIEKIGLFDKRFFCYVEDVDFCLRAKRAGFEIILSDNAQIYHKGASSSKIISGLAYFYINRNRFILAKNNSSPMIFLTFVLLMVIYMPLKLLLLALFQRKDLKPFIRGMFAGFKTVVTSYI